MLCANPAVVILLGVYHMNLQVYENVLSHWSQVTRPMWGEGWRLFVNCKFFWRPIVNLLSIVNCQAAVSIVDKIVIRLSIFILLCIFVAPATLYTWHLSSTVYKGLTFWEKTIYSTSLSIYIYIVGQLNFHLPLIVGYETSTWNLCAHIPHQNNILINKRWSLLIFTWINN